MVKSSEMTPSEIIASDRFVQEDGVEKVVSWMQQHLADGTGLLLRSHNSVMFVIRLAPGVVEVHLYTQDTPLMLAAAVREFYSKLKDSDITKVYGTTPRTPKIVELMRVIGVEVQNSDNPQYSWMANV